MNDEITAHVPFLSGRRSGVATRNLVAHGLLLCRRGVLGAGAVQAGPLSR